MSLQTIEKARSNSPEKGKNPEKEDEERKRVKEEYESELTEMFNLFDLNHDGQIEKAELLSLLEDVFKKANMKVTEKVMSYYQFKFDVNGDNSISLPEFIQTLDEYTRPIDRR